jgi:hypothetical protein
VAPPAPPTRWGCPRFSLPALSPEEQARTAAATANAFAAHLIKFAAGSEGVKLCPSTSTATVGEVSVSTAMPAPGVRDDRRRPQRAGLVSCVLVGATRRLRVQHARPMPRVPAARWRARRAMRAEAHERLLPYVQMGFGGQSNQCAVSPACSFEVSVHAERYAKLIVCC